jgi:hypothetical protein
VRDGIRLISQGAVGRKRLRQDASETSATILVKCADSYEIRRKARSGRAYYASVLKDTESVLAVCQRDAVKAKRSKKEREKVALDAVAREMGRPRFVESARREEEAATPARRSLKGSWGDT